MGQTGLNKCMGQIGAITACLHFSHEGEEEAAAAREPILSKAQLYKYYAGKSPIELYAELMLQPGLRQDCVIITHVAAPLEDKYSDLRAQAQGVKEMLSWAVKRAQGKGWCDTALKILKEALSEDLCSKLSLTGAVRPPLTLDLSQAWMVESCQ